MRKREGGWKYDGLQDDLWVKEVDETGQMMYVRKQFFHIVTDLERYTNVVTEMSQKAPPLDCRGGLLADQMGLGKSLTMIALIASNRCETTNQGIFTAQGYLRRLKSTLIVVPYSRQ
jgi:SWI/SNF-related matrix-associated actin-dependent regulator of chromatin subfamily A3